MANQDFILAPASVAVRFQLAPVKSMLHSMMLLNIAEGSSGLAQWVTDTADSLTTEQALTNELVLGTCFDGLIPREPLDNFPAYLESLEATDPYQLRDGAINWMRECEAWPGDESALTDVEAFVEFMRVCQAEKIEKGHEFRAEYWQQIHPMLADAPALKRLTIDHIAFMWENVVGPEWERVRPMLEESIAAFRQVDFTGLSAFEITQFVTGRDLRNNEHFAEELESIDRLVFTPSAHLGPYLSWFPTETKGETQIIYGARLPKGATVASPALSRSELLVRLSALADDTRLMILELLTRHEELCAQDFINMLDLSQSSASRHLRQLTATGFLTERRREVAKCYSLNPDRVDDTMNAVKLFLKHR